MALAQSIFGPPDAASAVTGGVLRYQTSNGTQSVRWSAQDSVARAAARRTFEELVTYGYRAYRRAPGGAVHEQITRFDPAAEEIVLILPLQGGAC